MTPPHAPRFPRLDAATAVGAAADRLAGLEPAPDPDPLVGATTGPTSGTKETTP